VSRWLLFLSGLPWYARLPVKWLVFAVTVLLVCYPNPRLLRRHLEHWRDPDRLIEPDARELEPLWEELRPKVAPELAGPQALKVVEKYVYDRIPYAWDWDTWGAADYLPTLAEVIEKGREDCDGRAVVAASLLRRLGFQAQIVTDLGHVWVKTDQGETMGPGKVKVVVATAEGVRVQEGAWKQVARAVAYGIAPFPLVRELIVLGVLWWLLLRPGGGALCASAALVLLLNGLIILRLAGADYRNPNVAMQMAGLLNVLGALAVLLVWGPRRVRRAANAANGAACSPSSVGLPRPM